MPIEISQCKSRTTIFKIKVHEIRFVALPYRMITQSDDLNEDVFIPNLPEQHCGLFYEVK